MSLSQLTQDVCSGFPLRPIPGHRVPHRGKAPGSKELQTASSSHPARVWRGLWADGRVIWPQPSLWPELLDSPPPSRSPRADPHWPGQGHLLPPEPIAVTLSNQLGSCYSTYPQPDL